MADVPAPNISISRPSACADKRRFGLFVIENNNSYLFHCDFSFIDLELIPVSRHLENAFPKKNTNWNTLGPRYPYKGASDTVLVL